MMFRFEDCLVGTDSHKRLVELLGNMVEEGCQVEYEEYIVHPGEKKKIKYNTKLSNSEIVDHEGREIRCRGFAETKS